MDAFGDEFVEGGAVEAPADGTTFEETEQTYSYGSGGMEEYSAAVVEGGADAYGVEAPVLTTEQYDVYSEPAPVEATYSAPVEAPLEENDPRVEFARSKSIILKERSVAEQAAKQAVISTAKAYLEKFYQQRKTMLASRHEVNRADEDLTKTVSVPTEGSAWDKITSLVDFQHSTHQKDVQRYKSTLLACKTQNIAVK